MNMKGIQNLNRDTEITHDANTPATTYILLGKVFPERHPMTLNNGHPIILKFPPGSWEDGCTIWPVRVSVTEAAITAVFDVDRPLSDISSAKNTIQHRIHQIVDLHGFLQARKFLVDITSGFQIIHEAPPQVATLSFNQNYASILHPITDDIEIDTWYELINRHPDVRAAFSEMREAFGDAFDTGFHAYRAIEIVRLEFEQKSDGTDKSNSWSRLRQFLDISRDDIDFVNDFSKYQRHGNQVVMSSEDRDRCIEVASRIIANFARKYDRLSEILC